MKLTRSLPKIEKNLQTLNQLLKARDYASVDLKYAWKRSGITIDEMADKVGLSYERTYAIYFGQKVGIKRKIEIIHIIEGINGTRST